MYVINPENLDPEKTYLCNGVQAAWLTINGIPLLSMDQERKKWYFAKTEELEQKIKEMPFWVRLSRYFE